jgi:hypothetical protein
MYRCDTSRKIRGGKRRVQTPTASACPARIQPGRSDRVGHRAAGRVVPGPGRTLPRCCSDGQSSITRSHGARPWLTCSVARSPGARCATPIPTSYGRRNITGSQPNVGARCVEALSRWPTSPMSTGTNSGSRRAVRGHTPNWLPCPCAMPTSGCTSSKSAVRAPGTTSPRRSSSAPGNGPLVAPPGAGWPRSGPGRSGTADATGEEIGARARRDVPAASKGERTAS